MNPGKHVDVPNHEQRQIMTNHISNLNEDSIPDSQVACLCSKPSGVKDDKYSYGHESDCFIASKGYVKVGRHLDEHRRMRRSLDLAKEVQQNLLPKNRPDYKGLDIAGKSIYCDETGGDYFDYHDLSEGAYEKLGVAIGDVSGHGISAALLMATVRAALRQRVSLKGNLKEIICDVNRQLVSDVEESGQFIGLFYLAVDQSKRTIKWVRAGHAPAILYDPETDTFEALNGPGVALGVDAGLRYAENEKSDIKKNQIIVLATDGILEARNPQGRMFGRSSLVNSIRRNKYAGAKQILDAVFNDLKQFRREAELEDDITLVVIKIED
jgi:sigma-B regulation protein RsbU (phosphoserine phosphatase)